MLNTWPLSKTLTSLGLALMVATAACQPSPPAEVDQPLAEQPAAGEDGTAGDPEATDVVVILAGEGIQLVDTVTGSTVPLEFSAEMPMVVDTVSRAIGESESTVANDECPAGPVASTSWPNGLVLNAMDGTLVGWEVRSSDRGLPLTTVTGIGLGSTQADLESAYEVEITDSSLGVEFFTGQISGLLTANDPEAEITALWAGTACIFR
ncbi:MAG: hypothetical protein WBA99_13240 [Nodosilinea sp.]